MINRLILVVSFFVVACSLYAQYTVSAVEGNVCLQVGKINTKVLRVQTLQPADKIDIPDSSSLSLLDVKARKMIKLQEPGFGAVSTLIERAADVKTLSETYLKYLVKKLFRTSVKAPVRTKVGVVYRGVLQDSTAQEQTIEYSQDDILHEDWRVAMDSIRVLVEAAKCDTVN